MGAEARAVTPASERRELFRQLRDLSGCESTDDADILRHVIVSLQERPKARPRLASDFVDEQLADGSLAARVAADPALSAHLGAADAYREWARGRGLLEARPLMIEDARGEAEGARGRGRIGPLDPASIPAGRALASLLHPLTPEDFESSVRGTHALLVRRPHLPNLFVRLFSLERLWQAAERQGGLSYDTEVDVARYRDATRETLNGLLGAGAGADGGAGSGDSAASGGGGEPVSPPPPRGRGGRVVAPAAALRRAFEQEGCSLRLLHPQRWSEAIWRLVAALESELGTLVGCNAYLTPGGKQGFAPHWDDVDVFVLQVEGEKRWKIHAPAKPADIAPRWPSADLEIADLGPLVLDVTLSPGDVLYLPRGSVHYAVALEGDDAGEPARASNGAGAGPTSLRHSLHLTISTDQRVTSADLAEAAAGHAARDAAASRAALRATLPPSALEAAGSARTALAAAAGLAADAGACLAWSRARSVLRRAAGAGALLPAVAAAADGMREAFVRSRLPPVGGAFGDEGGAGRSAVPVGPSSVVQPPPRFICHVQLRGDEVAVCHCLRNDRRSHAEGMSGREGGVATDGDEGRGAGQGNDAAGSADLSFPARLLFPVSALLGAVSGSAHGRGSASASEDEDEAERAPASGGTEGPSRAGLPAPIPLPELIARWSEEDPEGFALAEAARGSKGRGGPTGVLLRVVAELQREGLVRVIAPRSPSSARRRAVSDARGGERDARGGGRGGGRDTRGGRRGGGRSGRGSGRGDGGGGRGRGAKRARPDGLSRFD